MVNHPPENLQMSMKTLCLSSWRINRGFRRKKLPRVWNWIFGFKKNGHFLANLKGVIFPPWQHKTPCCKTDLSDARVKELKWITLQDPAYSPDMFPSDFHLFRSRQDNWKDKELTLSRQSKTASQSSTNKNFLRPTKKFQRKLYQQACRTIWDSC